MACVASSGRASITTSSCRVKTERRRPELPGMPHDARCPHPWCPHYGWAATCAICEETGVIRRLLCYLVGHGDELWDQYGDYGRYRCARCHRVTARYRRAHADEDWTPIP